MPFTTWIRDLFGVRKDMLDAKKTKFEIAKLEDEETERRGLVQLATLDDIKEYDPKFRAIKAKEDRLGGYAVKKSGCRYFYGPMFGVVLIIVMAVIFLVALVLVFVFGTCSRDHVTELGGPGMPISNLRVSLCFRGVRVIKKRHFEIVVSLTRL